MFLLIFVILSLVVLGVNPVTNTWVRPLQLGSGNDYTCSNLDIGSGDIAIDMYYDTSNVRINVSDSIIINNNVTVECIVLSHGGKVCDNTTCTIIYSPSGTTITTVCD